MAEAGFPRPDAPQPERSGPEPRPPSRPSPGAGRAAGRDPVALAAWRRVAEQRRRGADPASDDTTRDPDTADTPVVDPAPTPPRATAAAPAPTPEDDAPRTAEQPRVEPARAEEPAPAEPPRAPEPARPVESTRAPRPARAAEPVRATEPSRTEVPRPAEPARPSGPTVSSAPAETPPAPAPRVSDEPRRSPGAAWTPAAADHQGPSPRPDDGPPPPGRLHDVLLGFAGRVDDDALTAVREMVAVEDDAEAAELLAGCLLADAVAITPDERTALAPWFGVARVDADVLGRLPVDADAARHRVHRFVPAAGDRPSGLPLARAARRLGGVVAVRESWRVTPAGAAPGPVPHRVVLVETSDPDDCDHVVHHLAHAARGLGGTSVEVFATGAGLPAYHRDALAAARPLGVDEPAADRAAADPAEAPRSGTAAAPAEAVEDDGETWRTVADAGVARTTAPEPVRPARPAEPEAPAPAAAQERPTEPTTEPAGETTDGRSTDGAVGQTTIDDDLSVTARRIAALWARPAPEDFSAPLAPQSLARTRLEPEGPPPDDDRPGLVDDEPYGPADDELLEPAGDERLGRHGRAEPDDLGTRAFEAPRPAPQANGHPLPAGDERDDRDDRADTADLPGQGPAPASGPGPEPEDAADTDAQVLRARHSRTRDGEEPGTPTRFGHDARFGAGSGPAWPGAPVTGGHPVPGPDTLFTSPVEVSGDPVTLGTNGHRHEPPTGRAVEEPDTGPVAWAGPAPTTRPTDGQRPGPPDQDVAPPWAAANPGGWSTEPAPWSPPAEPHATETTAAWSPDTDDSVAQLSDRERELLARLHEELAQRERAEGADPFAGPGTPPSGPGRPSPGPSRPQPPAGPRGPMPPPNGRVNGHGLPHGPEDAGA